MYVVCTSAQHEQFIKCAPGIQRESYIKTKGTRMFVHTIEKFNNTLPLFEVYSSIALKDYLCIIIGANALPNNTGCSLNIFIYKCVRIFSCTIFLWIFFWIMNQFVYLQIWGVFLSMLLTFLFSNRFVFMWGILWNVSTICLGDNKDE